ncbi:long-chain acyl-CoA synthetase [Ferrithrix thermotolerans DSM 19514]|uniref:Long-chain acyl-CoA synthetase n=1 Tax=Ferrithrix thermotolerans DSM 19514 TaxID=1121881 RepID=A0A1M4SBK9_9ACTN|nr:class I adenylate-forming enzyme family protein [Ferrithrix thermotolerans]SHE29586.1 long-chain acyl-CoA synthetase [Ferrithrix thermotolerans DSM 19514]
MSSYSEVVEQLTAPGQRFELTTATVRGRVMTVFKNTPTSLNQLLEMARGYAGAPFLEYKYRSLSFEDVFRLSDTLATSLAKNFDVRPGDRVAIAMRNLPEWVICFKAIVSLGCVVVPLNAWWTAEELTYGLKDSGAKVVICDTERARRVIGGLQPLSELQVIAVPDDGSIPEGAIDFSDVTEGPIDLQSTEVGIDDDVTILYTSGTTGKPKGAVSTNRSTVSALLGFALRNSVNEALYPSKDQPSTPKSVLIGVPMFHITGCIVMLTSFITGARLSLMHHWDPADALEMIERNKITNFVGVPTMSWDILEAAKYSTYDISSLESIGGGGSPVPPKLVDRLSGELRTATPGFGYGLTETNAFGPGIAGEELRHKPSSAGRSLPIMEVKIVSPQGETLPPGTSGEICFYGAPVVRGYWNKEAETESSFPQGWLRTGDVGYLDEDGYLYLEDRIKDVIIRGGENVYSIEVEGAIYEHRAVNEVAVFGVPDERLGERVAAWISVKNGETLSEEEISEFLKTRLAYFKVPEFYLFSKEPLIRGATGKIQKRELKARFIEQKGLETS